jgi:hypothetical protein
LQRFRRRSGFKRIYKNTRALIFKNCSYNFFIKKRKEKSSSKYVWIIHEVVVGLTVLTLNLFDLIQGKGVYQYVDKYGANVDGYR